MSLPGPPADDARWTAFRYVADELDADERTAFEARLEADPDACAAVAEAVEVLGACLSLAPLGAPRRRPIARRAVPLIALAAAAAIVAALLPGGVDRHPADVDADRGGTIALERAWSRLQLSQTVVEDAADAWEADLLADLPGPASEEAKEPDPPGWLLAAVELDGGARVADPEPVEK